MMRNAKRAPDVLAACEIAATDSEPPDTPIKITAARKEFSATGCVREWWYRLVWRHGAWQYLGDRRLSGGTFCASGRHDAVAADVWPGEVLVGHDRGGPVNEAKLVTATGLAYCTLGRTRDGQLRIGLPDGTVLTRPNPRRSGRPKLVQLAS